mgnify:CR=1 FL=1
MGIRYSTEKKTIIITGVSGFVASHFVEDIYDNYDLLINPEFLICTSFNTHQAITFGDKNHLMMLPKERRKGDTTLW